MIQRINALHYTYAPTNLWLKQHLSLFSGSSRLEDLNCQQERYSTLADADPFNFLFHQDCSTEMKSQRTILL